MSGKVKNELWSMYDYIRVNYTEEMLDCLIERIGNGWNPLYAYRATYDMEKSTVTPKKETGTISSISLHYFSNEEIFADIVIRMDMDVTETHGMMASCQTVTCYFRADMWITLNKTITVEYSSFRRYRKQDEHTNGFLLDEYLVPYYTNDDLEEEAEALLAEYALELYENLKLPGELLAERLGLSVIYLPLYQRTKTQSILYFTHGKLRVKNGDDKNSYHTETVPGKTIVVNSGSSAALSPKTAIYH